MKYGYFTNGGKTFVINTPATPTSWTNKLFNDDFQVDISQRLKGAGKVMYPDFSNEPFLGEENRFYLNCNGNCFELFKNDAVNYRCEHRLYQTEVSQDCGDISVSIRLFVPANGAKEFFTVTLKNNGNDISDVSLFSVFPFVNPCYMTHYVKYDSEFDYIYQTGFPYYVKYDDKEKLEGDVRFRYVKSDKCVESYSCNRQRFFGSDDFSDMPIAVINNCCDNMGCELEESLAALHHKFILKPNDSETINILIGIEKTKEEADAITDKFPDVEKELEKIKNIWEERCSAFMIETPDENLNIFTNYWLKRQLIFFARLNRGGFYCPVRNQLQDYLGYAIIDPQDALNRALKIVKRQHHNGYLKQYYTTNGSPEQALCFMQHSDSYIWLIICLIEVIEKCGDKDLYNLKVEYLDSPIKESLLTHLKKAAYYMLTQRGEHKLCLMLDGDWNDPVNGPGRNGKGESTWNTMALCYAIERLNEVDFDGTLDKARKEMLEAINEHCWDGEWYLAGINDDGVPYGSHKDADAKRFLNAQTWAIISGAATGERLEKTVNTIESMGNEFGYTLIDPPFSKYNPIWGRVSLKMHGTTENGSVYCHSVMFKALADCMRGDGNAAYDTISRILPTNPEHSVEESLQIPIYYSNYYVGVKGENYGRSSCHYRTGTVAWHIWVLLEHIFGLNLSATNGAQLKSNIPSSWKIAKLTRKFGDKIYTVTYKDGKEVLTVKNL